MRAVVSSETIKKQINDISQACSEIKKARSEIQNGFQRLGTAWKDAKYHELEQIVNICNLSLGKIELIFLQSSKALEDILKNVNEYENTNLVGSSQTEWALGGNNDSPNVSDYDLFSDGSLLGVYTNGNTNDRYDEMIENRYENSDPVARKVFDLYKEQLCVQDNNYPLNQTPHYSPINYPGHPRGVYYNAGYDENNPRGNGTTYYHELGHMIDHASTGYNGYTSRSNEFRDALISDGQNVLRLFNQLPLERQEGFLRRIHQGDAHSFSDLIDAVTGGRLHGAYGHSREYWNEDGNLQAEAFAHFFEASMGSEGKRELLETFFPSAFGIFSGMLDDIVANQNELVLSLRRRL